MTVLERAALLPEIFARWFAGRGWTPRAHQLDLLAKARAGCSVLLIAPTGGGKTLAGFLPSLVELSGAATQSHSSPLAQSAPSPSRTRVFPGSATVESPKSETSDLGVGEGREGVGR